MNEERTITISIEEYKELLMSRIKLNTLAAYVDSANRKNAPCFDSEYISFILGVPARGVK